jgi:TolB-like protein
MEERVRDFISSELKEQLGLILKSRYFSHAATISSFLKFIVHEAVEDRRESVKEYVIATRVFSKPSDFNPQLDPIVRINAGRLRRALDDYYRDEGKHDSIVISLPKGSYVPVFSRQPTMDATTIIREFPLGEKPVVAVLPFININPKSPHIFFADGLADHISTELTQYPELSVISYYSCRNLLSRITDLSQVAELLKADFILTGSVQTNRDHLRVGISLVSCKTNEQIWAKSIDRIFTSEELMEIEDEIAGKVISQVAGHYGVIFRNLIRSTRRTTRDSKIHNAIFWYYHFVSETNEELFIQAEEALHQAIEADPEYALGWAVLGEIKTAAYFMGYTSSRTANLLEDAVRFGQKSLKLDPQCQHGYQTLTLANLFLHNKEEVIKISDDWSALNYGASGIKGGIGFCLICCGEYEKGYSMLHDSISLNPYYQWWLNAGICFYHIHGENYSEALVWAKKINMPHIPWTHILEATCHFHLGDLIPAEKKAAYIRHEFPFMKTHLNIYISSFINDPGLTNTLLDAMKSLGF